MSHILKITIEDFLNTILLLLVIIEWDCLIDQQDPLKIHRHRETQTETHGEALSSMMSRLTTLDKHPRKGDERLVFQISVFCELDFL